MNKLRITALLSFLCAATLAFGQEAACPKVTVTSPDVVTAGDALSITANVSGGDDNVSPTYNWSVSDGTIASGQGTASISIDTKEAASGSITATVEVGGYAPNCSTTSSTTTMVDAPKAKDDAPEEKKPPKE